MASIKQCPGTSEDRTSRSNINKCPTLDNYHCLKTEDGQLRELCTSPIWIEAGKCPIYSVTGKLDARICQATSSTECPTKVYKSNVNFNYAGCLPRFRVESHTTKVTGDEQTTQIHNVMPSNGSGTSAGLVAVCIVVPLFIIGLVFLCWWKRNEIQKLITNPFRSRNTTSAKSDVEATGTSVSSETPNKKSGSGETNISLNIKDVMIGSTGEKENAENTKDNTKTSNTDEESKLLLNVDESAKENDEKIKIETPDNEHISKEVTYLLDENLTKEEPYSKPSTKESKRRLLKLRLPFQKGSSGKKKQQNNKPAKKEIMRPENEKTSKADACRKTKNPNKPSTKESKRSSSKFAFPFQKRSSEKHNTVEIEDTATNMTEGEENCLSDDISIKEKQNNKPTKEKIKISDNENTSKADAFEKTDQSQSMVLFKKDMANLLLKKDVLILACHQHNEKINLGMEIAMNACEKTTGAHIRVFNALDDFDQFEGLTKDEMTLFVSFDCSRNFDLFSETQISNTFKRIKKAARNWKKTNTCHTLICLHISTCNACKELLKKNSMTYEVYDISTMQIYKEA
nr:uncharacterized protein LOC105317832 isoform X4 [Crassostrea gigas]